MKIEYKDARILREALARIHNQMPVPHLRQYIDRQMRAYAKSVGEYCEHPEKAEMKRDNDKILRGCLDCGMRFTESNNEREADEGK